MIVYKDLQQGSEAWQKFRLGKATASEASKVLTPGGKVSKSSIGYARKLSRECIADDPMVWMGSKYTDWGHAMEPEAREEFINLTGIPIEEYGMVTREDKLIAASPDGLCLHGPQVDGEIYEPRESDVGLEVKCPQVDTHVGYLMEGVVPTKYVCQLQWSLAATGLTRWFFMSYFPGLNPLIIEVKADEFTEKVKAAQDQFLIDYAEERERVFDAILPSRRKDPEEAMKQASLRAVVQDLI